MRNYVYQIVARDVGKVIDTAQTREQARKTKRVMRSVGVTTDIIRFAREVKTVR